MRKSEKYEVHNSLKRSIEEMFANGDELNEEAFQELESSKPKYQRCSQNVSSPTGPSVILNLRRLNGEFLDCDDISSLIHFSVFGSVVSKPKWVVLNYVRGLLQTLVLRVNCPDDFIENSTLPFVDEFFNREWVQTSPAVNCRQEFWNSLLNVQISVQEQVKLKCMKASKYQKETGKIDKSDFLVTLEEMASNLFPFPGEEDIIPTKKKYLPISAESPLFSVDCEMCITTAKIHELTRITIVGEMGEILLDTLVKPRNQITDYLTQYSGITRELLEGVETRLEDVQRAVQSILPPDAILVGHSLQYDLRAMKMAHPYCIDASLALNYTNNSSMSRNSLKNLVELFLNEEIQNEFGHCSYEDAWAAMRLVKLKLEKGIAFGNVRNGWNKKTFVDDNHVPEKKTVKRRVRAKKKSCTGCNLSMSVDCTVKDCHCVTAPGPSICLHCHCNKEIIEGSFDWKESLKFEECPKKRPINQYLRNNKMTSIVCAFDETNLEIPSCNSKRMRWKSPNNFKTYDDFVNNVASQMIDDKLVLCELDHERIHRGVELKDDEASNMVSSYINSKIEQLIKSVTNNSLVLLVLASKQKSIIYVKIKPRQDYS